MLMPTRATNPSAIMTAPPFRLVRLYRFAWLSKWSVLLSYSYSCLYSAPPSIRSLSCQLNVKSSWLERLRRGVRVRVRVRAMSMSMSTYARSAIACSISLRTIESNSIASGAAWSTWIAVTLESWPKARPDSHARSLSCSPRCCNTSSMLRASGYPTRHIAEQAPTTRSPEAYGETARVVTQLKLSRTTMQ